jgi:hypothetical protein
MISIWRSTARSAELMSAGDRGAIAQQRLHFGQRLTEHARHVAALGLFRERDRRLEMLFLKETRELGDEPDRLPLRAAQLQELHDEHGHGPDRHEHENDHDRLGKPRRVGPQIENVRHPE